MSIWFILWWGPMIACLLGYIRLSVLEYIKERRSRALCAQDNSHWFVPNLTIGVLVSRVVLSTIPLINIVCLLDLSAGTVSAVYDRIQKIMSIPLVSQTK